MHESRELCLEEVKSKETDHLATTDEARAADALLGNGNDGNMEVVVEKDVLVEEITRSETTHEEKVIYLRLSCCFLNISFRRCLILTGDVYIITVMLDEYLVYYDWPAFGQSSALLCFLTTFSFSKPVTRCHSLLIVKI